MGKLRSGLGILQFLVAGANGLPLCRCVPNDIESCPAILKGLSVKDTPSSLCEHVL